MFITYQKYDSSKVIVDTFVAFRAGAGIIKQFLHISSQMSKLTIKQAWSQIKHAVKQLFGVL